MDTNQLADNATNAGFTPYTINILKAVALTIADGEVVLPISQMEAEDALINDDPVALINLIFRRPALLDLAKTYYTENYGKIN